MLFNSYQFLIFFPIVTLLYFVMPYKLRRVWLLLSSYFFYMCWNAKFILLIFASTIVTFLSGILMEKFRERKKLIVAGSLIINLGILVFFKYTNFLLESVGSLFSLISVDISIPRVDILLPVGISFYTFQALSYTMDVYRKEIEPEHNFVKYALFVSFFPQLVAGPIERSKNLLRQLDCRNKFNFEKFKEGFLLMLWGYFLKLVLADRIALFVDTVYENPADYKGWYLIVATVLFAVQIYCDFAGYSTIAIGTSKILGVELMENFNAPYLATTVSDFWRRWHISLTSWFKDYLYIPLGGNRKGTLRKYINIMIVFLVSGLWHGASMSFVLWGGLNGLYQVIGGITLPIRKKISERLGIKQTNIVVRFFKALGTFILVDFAWMFFRAGTIRKAGDVLSHMFDLGNISIFSDGSIFECGLGERSFIVLLLGIALLLFADIMKERKITVRDRILNMCFPVRCLLLVLFICLILLFGIWGAGYDSAGFIYFQF